MTHAIHESSCLFGVFTSVLSVMLVVMLLSRMSYLAVRKVIQPPPTPLQQNVTPVAQNVLDKLESMDLSLPSAGWSWDYYLELLKQMKGKQKIIDEQEKKIDQQEKSVLMRRKELSTKSHALLSEKYDHEKQKEVNKHILKQLEHSAEQTKIFQQRFENSQQRFEHSAEQTKIFQQRFEKSVENSAEQSKNFQQQFENMANRSAEQSKIFQQQLNDLQFCSVCGQKRSMSPCLKGCVEQSVAPQLLTPPTF